MLAFTAAVLDRACRVVTTAMLSGTLLLFAVLTFSSLAGAQLIQRSTPANDSLDLDNVLKADDATDIDATTYVMRAVHNMLYAEDFDRLDALADSLRRNKVRFSGGMWKIHTFYGGTRPFGHATEDDWKQLEAILTRWAAAKPKSVTARVALAQMYLDYAWSARGDGYASTVSKSGWKLFESRTSKAKEVLDSARALPEICPEWFLEMQSVALNQGWPKEGKAELLKSAISFEPGYYYYYREHALSLLPKWDGEPGEVEKFIADSSDRIGGAEGDILYFRVASFLSGEREVFEKLSFRRIRQGFTQSERVYGVSLTNMNLFAYMAWIFQEAGVADPIFKRIGDQWSEDPFGSEATFENGKKWAAQFAEIIPDTSDLEEKMKTPEGQRYDAEFRTKFADLIQSCLEKADAAEGPVRLLASIAGDGTISTMRTLQGNSKGVCLFQAGHQKLSPPSHAPFQILLTFNIPLQTAPK